MPTNCKSRSVIAVLMLTAFGCGESKPPAYPVSGVVQVDGKPAEGVRLTFYAQSPPAPELEVPIPTAFTDSQGHYEVTTYSGADGAPAGDYRIAAAWMTKRPENADPESFETQDRLKERYADPSRSDLTATIIEGNNELETIELSSRSM